MSLVSCPSSRLRMLIDMLIGPIRDTFTGAYASNYLQQKENGNWDIKTAVIRANKAASITIQSVGAQGGIPWSDEIDNFDAPPKIYDSRRSSSTADVFDEA